jgi:hypothetical protein
MTSRGTLRPPLRQLGLASSLALACLLAACKGEKPGEPAEQASAPTRAAPRAPTKEQAMASLMELPEVKTWSEQIEKNSRGKSHGAVIEDDPQARMINGKPYWQFSFVENRADAVHRVDSFLVAKSGEEILIEDPESDKLLTLPEWRRTVHKVELR